MHTKSYDGLEIHFPGPDLHQDEIDSLMSFLHHQLEEIDSYSDKSLFFQNPQIFEGWLALVRAIEKIETWEVAEDKTKWEDRTETYVAYLLTLRDYYYKYENLYQRYYEQLSKILDCYGGWLIGDCISADGIEAMSADKYSDDLENVDDIVQHLTKLNNDSLKARSAVHSVLTDVMDILMPVMNRGALVITDKNPTVEDFAKAIDDDLREWTFSFGRSMFREMKEDLNRHFKEYRTAPYTPELWGQLLGADEDALNMAKRHELASCNDAKQEHWGEDMKAQMDENGKLMQLIYYSCRTEELFDLRMVDDIQPFISLLTPDNLAVFYDIIVRRSLIQCEMFPELKAQHDYWLNSVNEQPEEDDNEKITCNDIPLPKELQTKQAQPLFEALKKAGFIKEEGYALAEGISNNQAAYIADRMSNKLKIKNKWKVFQGLWGIPNMAQLAGSWQQTGKLPPQSKEIDKIME